MYEGAAWLYEFIIHARWQCTAHWAKDRRESRNLCPSFFCALAYIFRESDRPRSPQATQGGRGMLPRKRRKNPFSLDPFVLIMNKLRF